MSEASNISDSYDTEYEVGQDNIKMLGMDLHNPVFFISAFIILTFVIGTLMFPAEVKTILGGAKSWSINNFDWLFMWVGNIILVFCLVLVVLPVGKIRLGGEGATPEFSRLSWLAMLFSAGIGIGLMFWGVAEPLAYYTSWGGTPLNVAPNTAEAAEMAMAATMFHWGFHPWAMYALVALSLAFFTFNKGMPLTIRSAFYPLLGDACWGWAGHIIDLLAVFATIFGLATSLGLGAQQATGGLNHLFDIPNTINTQLIVIAGITSIAIVSVVRGLDGGVKVLSNINMGLALALLVFILILGQGFGIFANILDTSVAYISNIIPLSNPHDREDEAWLHGWTVFYWAWWISWSPFVGLFIARISKGRTVREFILTVLLVPTFVTLIWMTAFGNTGIEQAMNGVGQLADGITDASLTTFYMLENLPFSSVTTFFGIILVLVFFITSSDSGSLVIDSITAGGKLDAPVPQRIFWASMEGLIAAALLYGGGEQALQSLQAGTITVGLPFAIVLLFMCVSLYKGLTDEVKLMKGLPAKNS